MKFLQNTANEIAAQTEGMSKRERWRYIWEYYWLWIVGILAAAVFAVYFFSHVLFGIKEFWFYATFVNLRPGTGVQTELRDEYVAYRQFDLSEKGVVFNDACYFDATTLSGTNNNYYQSFVAVVEAGDLDVVVMEQDNLIAVGASGRLLDLEAENTASYFEAYKDRFVYATPYDEEYSTEPVAVGIDISDSRLMTEYGIYEGSCVLGVGAYTKHPEEVAAFLDFIGVK